MTKEIFICPNYEQCLVDNCDHNEPHSEMKTCKLIGSCPKCKEIEWVDKIIPTIKL